MRRPIVGFEQDAEGDWVAALSCGHGRHVRHVPPLSERPWVQTAQGRAGRLGTELDCVRCERGELPEGFEPYRRTPLFDERSAPEALLRRHATKRGVWACIHVTRGALAVHQHAPLERHERLTPGTHTLVPPELEHHVEPVGAVSFFVELWRRR